MRRGDGRVEQRDKREEGEERKGDIDEGRIADVHSERGNNIA